MEMRAISTSEMEAFQGAEPWQLKETRFGNAKVVREDPPLICEGAFSSGKEWILVASPEGLELWCDDAVYLLRIPFETQAHAIEFCAILNFEAGSEDAVATLFNCHKQA